MIIGISGKIGSGKDTIGKIIQYLTYCNIIKESISYEEYFNRKPGGYDGLYQIKKYADKLKQIVSILTGIPVEDLEKQEVKDRLLGEEWKRSYYIGTLQYKVILEAVVTEDKIYKTESLTVRQLLQEIGTEAMRNVIHPNIWVNALFANYKDKSLIHKGGNIYVTEEEFLKDPVVLNNKNYTPKELLEANRQLSNWIITDMRFPNELQAVKNRSGITIRVNRPELTINNHLSETSLDSATFDFIINNNKDIEHLINEVKKILKKLSII